MKFALLGTGRYTRVHCDALRKAVPDVEIIVASRNEEAARLCAHEIGANAHLAPYSAAIADPAIDGIFIITPHHLHAELAVESLRAGKHVYLEKPIARSSDEAGIIEKAAGDNPQSVLIIGENIRFSPALRAAKSALDAGDIGPVRFVIANAIRHVNPNPWRKQRELMGGGALIDGGVHFIHGLRMLAGEVESVFAYSPPAKSNDIEGDETVQLLARLQSGASAALTYSWGNHGNPRLPQFVICAERGSMQVSAWERSFIIYNESGEPNERAIDPSEFDRTDADGHVATVREFIDCIRTGRQPETNLYEGWQDLKVVEAAYRSLETSHPEPVL